MALSTSRAARPISFIILGICFAAMGGFTLLNVLAALVQFDVILGRAIIYTIMDFLIAYGFLSRQRWLLWAVALNCASIVILCLIALARGTLMGSAYSLILALLMNASVLWWVWEERKVLVTRAYEYLTGGLFALLWLCALAYTVVNLLR